MFKNNFTLAIINFILIKKEVCYVKFVKQHAQSTNINFFVNLIKQNWNSDNLEIFYILFGNISQLLL